MSDKRGDQDKDHYYRCVFVLFVFVLTVSSFVFKLTYQGHAEIASQFLTKEYNLYEIVSRDLITYH